MKFYVTTPIYYVNDRPHIGHVYTTTIADIVARYHRLCGDEVFFLTGTDEHAAKVVDSAAEHGVTAQQWADQNAKAFQDTFAKLGITNDDFIRTSQERHKVKVQQYVGELLKTGDVYLGDYEGWYDAGQEEYLPENKAKEYEFKSPFNGKPLVRKKEKNYFFRLSKYGDALLKLLEERPEFVRPDVRRNEVLNRIREGLNDVPISRAGASEWGIRVPGDAEHTIYVWIDALFNYLSTVDTDERRKFWPADVHLIAKDILWFHAVIWPAMLIALKRELPRQVYAHSFWISEGQKMSKSLGNFVDIEKIDRYVANFGLDALRYFLGALRAVGDQRQRFRRGEVQRSVQRRTGRQAGQPGESHVDDDPAISQRRGARGERRRPCRPTRRRRWQRIATRMNRLDFVGALEALWDFVVRSNQYVEESAPWKLAKDPAKARQLDGVLYNLAESVRLISVLVTPFMPTTSGAIRDATRGGGQARMVRRRNRIGDGWRRGRRSGQVAPLFPKRT